MGKYANAKFPYEELEVWQYSIELAEIIYKIAKSFPEDERYGLSSQIRRCTSSIGLNIAEGKGRHSKKEFKHFLYIARASLYELSSCLELALRLKYIDKEQYSTIREKAFQILFMINSLIKSII